LVEDNPVNTLVAEALLQQWGVEVVLAGNGTEALDVLRRETQALDAVLMDLQMPVMDGLEATRQIRKTYAFDQLPVIALTAGVMLAERESALNSDMNDFLAKPIEPEQLAHVLSHWVNKARAWRASHVGHSGLQPSQ
jgi:CheY-like chemotaxis protein